MNMDLDFNELGIRLTSQLILTSRRVKKLVFIEQVLYIITVIHNKKTKVCVLRKICRLTNESKNLIAFIVHAICMRYRN